MEWWLIAAGLVVLAVVIASDVGRAHRTFWPGWDRAMAERSRRAAEQERLHELTRRDEE